MGYEEDLPHRVRELLADEDGLTEVRMFGGLAFLVNGNMSVAVSSHGGLLVRVGPEAGQQALARPHTEVPVMGGRQMRSWIRVSAEGLSTKRRLRSWVLQGAAFAR